MADDAKRSSAPRLHLNLNKPIIATLDSCHYARFVPDDISEIDKGLTQMTTLDLIGSSPKFRALMADVARVAPVDSAVLIQGETGTGKEVIARAIHEASPRRNQR